MALDVTIVALLFIVAGPQALTNDFWCKPLTGIAGTGNTTIIKQVTLGVGHHCKRIYHASYYSA